MSDQRKYFYKYKYIDDQNLGRSSLIFTHNELYFSSKNQFNDPFDCKFDYSFVANDKDLKKYFKKLLQRNHPDWNRPQRQHWIRDKLKQVKAHNPTFEHSLKLESDKFIQTIGIHSLSRIPSDILMWSHYADSHKGFCIKIFDDENDFFISRAQAVTYSDEYPIVNPIIDDDQVRLEKSLLTKAEHWNYEEEWRIIDPVDGPGIKRFSPHLLVGVIFGCRMSEDHKRLIQEWCNDRETDVVFYQAREASRRYALDINPI